MDTNYWQIIEVESKKKDTWSIIKNSFLHDYMDNYKHSKSI